MNSWRIFTVLLLVGVGTAAMADTVYRWKDDQGVLHYTDVPPKGVQAEVVDLSRLSVVSIPVAESPAAVPECEPGYRGDRVCESGQHTGVQVPESEPAIASVEAGAADSEKKGQKRFEKVEKLSEQIRDYDKQERIKEIEAERKLRKEQLLTPGG